MKQNSIERYLPELERAIDCYGNMLYRICAVSLSNLYDAEDALQDVFVRYIEKAPTFLDPEHEKAWLIRVTINICKNKRRFNLRHSHCDLYDYADIPYTDDEHSIIKAVTGLPEKYKLPMLLHYVEGYSCSECAAYLGISDAALRKRLQYGRNMIKLEYDRSDFDEA